MNEYRYQLERYRGRGTRYTCPQCGRKYTFTRYIDTDNNNIYISDNVGKCNRLDKCGYHYTPRQYYTDNPWKRDEKFSFFLLHRENERKKISEPRPICTIPEWVVEGSCTRGVECDHVVWLARVYGAEAAERIKNLYNIGSTREGHAVFWQRDIEGRVRTGKIMAYDPISGHRKKGAGSINWVHSLMQQRGQLPEDWQLTQCLYGEHLLPLHPDAVVALVEAYKTAHVGAILMPDMVWCAVDSMSGLTAERLRVLRGRRVVLFPDEGRGFSEWSARIEDIARSVGFEYRVSRFVEECQGIAPGSDLADLTISN